MTSRKMKGVLIIICFIVAVFGYKKLESMTTGFWGSRAEAGTVSQEEEKASSGKAGRDEAGNAKASETEVSDKETTATEVSDEETAADSDEETTTEEPQQTELDKLWAIEGEPANLYCMDAEIRDNYGMTHQNAYEFTCDDACDYCTYYLNGAYTKLTLTGIALRDCDKDDKHSCNLKIEGDGVVLGSTDNFTAGSEPQPEVVIDVTGVKKLTVTAVGSANHYNYNPQHIIVDSIVLSR